MYYCLSYNSTIMTFVWQLENKCLDLSPSILVQLEIRLMVVVIIDYLSSSSMANKSEVEGSLLTASLELRLN